jgi:hypothetical protein
VSPFFAVFLVLLLASSSYAAGRLHGQLSYRIGYRHGYRQGYFDGDRGAWSRRRRDAGAAVAAVLPVSPDTVSAEFRLPGAAVPPPPVVGLGTGSAATAIPGTVGGSGAVGAAALDGLPVTLGRSAAGLPAVTQGTTYTGASFAGTATDRGRHSTEAFAGGSP